VNLSNGFFWSRHFREVFEPQVSSVLALLEGRLLPTFGKLETEAEEATQAEWDRLMSMSGPEDADMGDLAETAYDAGIAHFSMMTGLQQGLQNLFSVSLHHLFEQQAFIFLRKEVLDTSEDGDAQLFKTSVLRKRLKDYGIDIGAFRCWPVVDELRLVANTVKHTEGDSAFKLFKLRPDLFSPSNSVFEKSPWPKASARVYSPLMGEDIYITTEQLKIYAAAVTDFWQEMAVSMTSA